MTALARHGLRVQLPSGWDGAISRRASMAGEVPRAVLHAATFALPAERGDYGGGAVDLMGPDDVFVCIHEWDPADAGRGLYAADSPGLPLHPDDFLPTSLQHLLPGQSGLQRFYSQAGRALCLYVVLGSHVRRSILVPRANAVAATLIVESAA